MQSKIDILVLSILAVAYDWVSLIGHVNTYLIFPAGQKINLHKAELLRLFENFISRMREPAFRFIIC